MLGSRGVVIGTASASASVPREAAGPQQPCGYHLFLIGLSSTERLCLHEGPGAAEVLSAPQCSLWGCDPRTSPGRVPAAPTSRTLPGDGSRGQRSTHKLAPNTSPGCFHRPSTFLIVQSWNGRNRGRSRLVRASPEEPGPSRGSFPASSHLPGLQPRPWGRINARSLADACSYTREGSSWPRMGSGCPEERDRRDKTH